MAGKINTGSLFSVGRTPWSTADALVGLPARPKKRAGGPAADQGVRPTKWRLTLGNWKIKWYWGRVVRHAG